MKFKDLLLQLLKTDSRLLDPEGELMGNKIQDLADKTDEKLIELLLDNAETREKFFLKIKTVYVFKTSDFKFYLDENKIDNSYTQYENRIGLTSKGKFLKDSNDVVLDFPYKDCILEGGQSTEEGTDTYFEWDEKDQHYTEKQAKRKEIFFNNVLAKDEIDRLLEPKAFTNATKYSIDAKENLSKFERNENGTIKDNLIIKGNNLLALHSIKKEFAGKVKLIYIDPPYNTGNDSFAYNDNFNHSTWLTFMRNRLLVAKELLREDGVIFISVDDNEYTYLRSILDDIFSKERFENIFHIKVRHENRILRQDARYQKVMEQTICYSMPNYLPNRIKATKDKNLDYNFIIQIKKDCKPILVEKINGFDVEIYSREDYEIIKSAEGNLKEYNIRGSLITQKGSASEFYELFLRNRKKIDGNGALYRIVKMGEKGDGLGYRYIRQPFDNGNNGFYYQGKPLKTGNDKGNPYPNYFDFEKEFNNSAEEGAVVFKNGKKPELFLNKLFEIANLERGNIILDFHIGSGSSSAVAHKLGFQYIGIEQMENQMNLSKTRLQNVIKGDSTGISKSVNWQGGGSFVYLELAKNNQNAIEKIQYCKSYEELTSFFNDMCEKYFLHYNVKVKQFRNEISKEENFKKLGLNQQKQLFIKMLDLNQLYVNVSDMEDKKYNLSADDIAITKDFYQL